VTSQPQKSVLGAIGTDPSFASVPIGSGYDAIAVGYPLPRRQRGGGVGKTGASRLQSGRHLPTRSAGGAAIAAVLFCIAVSRGATARPPTMERVEAALIK